ncbi:MAG: aminopeptidase [Marinilabiliales bacterium]|nr:MAG: aminopeptidase [Marinilabiliales bacterium]
MKTKRLFTLLITAVVSISTFAQEKNEGYQFKDLTDIKVTTVKDQQSTGTCWSFSTTSFIEAELLRMNNKVYDLSEMYFVRYAYEEKGQDFVRYHGNNNFGEGGQAHDVMNQIKRYGFITQEAYQGNQYDPGNYRHRELDKILQAILDVIITKPNRKLTTVWFDAYKSVLDAYLGEVPANFNLNGKEITPKDFVKKENFNTNDYLELTSFIHHPVNEKVILEVPDNWSNDYYYNITLEDFMEVMNYALKEGYTFVWDGDVGHDGFEHKKNVAVVPAGDYDFTEPKEEKKIDVDFRQKQFDNLTTTDDHLMHITGLAKDQNGTIYYKTKNSWGDDSNSLGGYLYMSESYMRLNSIAIMVHKDAIPKEIKNKLGL